MDNNMNPFSPQPSGRSSEDDKKPAPAEPELPPAMNTEQPTTQPAEQPATQTAQQTTQPAPAATAPLNSSGPILNNTGVDLGSPILAPTHFDGMKDPNVQGQQPLGQNPQVNNPKSDAEKAKTYMILSIIFGALAFIGIIVGIWSLVANINTSSQLATAESALKTTDAIVSKVEEETGKTIRSVEDVPEYNPVTGYIYITEWGIKFKIPEDLENVSYTLDQKYRPQICFAAHKTGIKYFPSFADIDKNPGGLGCVTRVATYEGDSDKDTGKSFGQKIFTYGDYNYFYTAPEAHFSQDAAEQGLEDTAVQIIKNMIANNISHYE